MHLGSPIGAEVVFVFSVRGRAATRTPCPSFAALRIERYLGGRSGRPADLPCAGGVGGGICGICYVSKSANDTPCRNAQPYARSSLPCSFPCSPPATEIATLETATDLVNAKAWPRNITCGYGSKLW